jgi:hypothetical protein
VDHIIYIFVIKNPWKTHISSNEKMKQNEWKSYKFHPSKHTSIFAKNQTVSVFLEMLNITNILASTSNENLIINHTISIVLWQYDNFYFYSENIICDIRYYLVESGWYEKCVLWFISTILARKFFSIQLIRQLFPEFLQITKVILLNSLFSSFPQKILCWTIIP